MNDISIKKHYILASILSVLFIVIDQLTKFLAVTFLKDTDGFVIIDGIFKLQYLENRGAAFGILQGQQLFFFVMTVLVLVVLSVIYGKIPSSKKFYAMRVCAILVFSGAIGNMIDRATLNYVVDFLYFELIDFPIFNVADIYVTVSTVVFALLILFYYKDSDLEQIKLKNKKFKI